MEASRDTIVARMETINQKLMEGNSMTSQSWSRETLLDAFVSYYEECSAEYLRDNQFVKNFIDTYRFTISELKKLRINISDFEVLQLIGNGNFGTVHLVKERQTGKRFAMKTIRKAQTVNNKQTCYAAERDIMATTTSPWHVMLQYAFHDSTKLYLVMDYHPGGDLRGLLERQTTVLDEADAVFYLREIIVAISHLHDMGFIHRDIKPDNVLLDQKGHVKLADFGSAARIGSDGNVARKDNIAAGTPEYVAPEVLVSNGKPNKAYGRSCDYWALGIIAYEMIFGVTPFTGDTTLETYNNIVAFETKLLFPEDVVIDKDYSNFIKQLLTDELIRPDYEKIICNPLFRDTRWDSVRDFQPPFVPGLIDPEDTSLFTGIQMQPHQPNIENFMTKSQFSGRNLPFVGYTYTAPQENNNEGPSPPIGALRQDESLLERKQRKIESLRNRLVQFEMMKEEQVALEQKYEESKLVLKSAKRIRTSIEQELAAAVTETSCLRTTLEAERNERKDLELRAIDLIRSAKARWKEEEDVRNAELVVLVDTQTQQITDLTTSNNELTEKLHKVTETAASCAMELQRLRDVQEQYEHKLKNSRDQSRKSFSGLQSQLKLVSDDAESRVESLKKELEDAWISNRKLQEQSEEIRQQNKLLESKLKANEEDFKAKLCERDSQIAGLNHAQEEILSELTASNERENNLQDQVTILQEEKVILKAKCDKVAEDKEVRERECEQLRMLYSTNSDKLNSNLECAVAEQKAKDEVRVNNLQNRVNQLENEMIDLLQQIQENETSKTKIAELECLVARLEAGKTKDTAATAREELLKEQLEKSENKVKQLHESAALSNSELGKLKSELWAKEKSLKDSGIDARILARELQDAQKEIKALQAQAKICEERAKIAEDLVNVDHERARAAEAKHLALVNENAGLKSRVARLEEQVHKLETMETEAATLKAVRQEMERKIEQQEKELAEYSKSAATARQLEISAKHEISRLRADLDTQHTAYAALQESSTILEQQVDGYDRLVVTLKNKETLLEAKITGLENDLAAMQEILQSTKQTLRISRNDRIGLDNTIRVLEVQISDLNSEKQSLIDDLIRFERRYQELVENSTYTERDKAEAVQKVNNYKSMVETLKTEILQLKEETSERLTQLLQAREVNSMMSEELIQQRDEIDRLTEAICETELDRDESIQRHRDEILSLAVRLKQFEKVSDSLLDRLAIEARKKKSLTSIFQRKIRDPPRPCTYFELNKQFAALQSEHNELRMKHELLEHALETPMTIRVQTAMANASVLDARDAQAIAAARLAKAAVDASKALASVEKQQAYQKAQEEKAAADAKEEKAVGIVSRAESFADYLQAREDIRVKVAKAAREAAQEAAAALELSEVTVAQQPTLAASKPRADHHVDRSRTRLPEPSQSSPSPTQDYDISLTESHCFQHFSCMAVRKCRWCWQPIKLLRGAATCRNCGIIVHKTCQRAARQGCGVPQHLFNNYKRVKHDIDPPTPSFDFQNIGCWVYHHRPEQRAFRYLQFVNRTLRLYAAMPGENTKPEEQYPLENVHANIATDVSGRFHGTNLDMFVAVQIFDTKEAGSPRITVMVQFLTDWDREIFLDANIITNSNLIAAIEKFPYVIQSFSSILELTSMIELDNLFLIGGAQGLHAVPYDTENLITFVNISNIQQITQLSEINSIFIIAGTEGELFRINSTELLNLHTLISNPVLNTIPVKISNHSEAVLSFQCTVVNNIAIVCAATAKQIIILQFNADSNDFQTVRILDSAEPCSALHIHQNSLLICADKFFNLDLATFKVHEMVDATDPGLAHVSTCQRAGTYPASVICLSINPPEYMLCYSEFAVFVDKNGRKSRHAQINWKHFPLHFAYCSPNLFVFQFSAIEILRVCPEMTENNREHWTCPASMRIDLIRPKYLTSNDAGIYYSCLKHHGVSSKNMYEQVCYIPGTISPKQLVQHS